jgi:hypothetical protein
MRLTLDQIEAERGEVEPFEIELDAGQVITLPHPKDISFEAIATFDDSKPASVLRALMGDRAFDAFAANPRVTLHVLEQVMAAYYLHFGLGDKGKGNASGPSSIGSARRSRRTSPGSKSA